MNLYQELLYKELGEYILRNFDILPFDFEKTVSRSTYQALSEIRDVVCNPELEDFSVVEEIVNIFEKYGIDSGFRHDFI